MTETTSPIAEFRIRGRRDFAGFLVLQAVGVVVGWAFALGEIRSILWLGPIASVLGLATAYLAWRRGWWLCFAFGFAMPTLSVLCLVLINAMRWGPDEAYWPINTVLTLYMLANAPLCGFAVRETTRSPSPLPPGKALQFSIAGIMAATVVVATTLALQRAFGFNGILTAIVLWYGLTALWFGRAWWKRRPPGSEPVERVGKRIESEDEADVRS